MRQVGHSLAVVVVLEVQSRVDVARGRGGAHDAPVGAREVVPGEFLAGVDLLGQLLALVGRAGDSEGAVARDLLVGGPRGLGVVPVLGVVGVDGEAVTRGGEQHVHAVVIEHVGAARDEAHVDRAGGEGLAHRLIAGAHRDVHGVDGVALLAQLVDEHLLEGLGGRDDVLRVLGGDEGDVERVDHLVVARGGRGVAGPAATGREAEGGRAGEQRARLEEHAAAEPGRGEGAWRDAIGHVCLFRVGSALARPGLRICAHQV